MRACQTGVLPLFLLAFALGCSPKPAVGTPTTTATGTATATGTGTGTGAGTGTGTGYIATPEAPVAVDDAATVAEGAVISIDVTGNDTDANGDLDADSARVLANPLRGTVTVLAGGVFEYTHDGGESTTDSFTYRVQDFDVLTSNEATVTVTITPVNDPPVARDDATVVESGQQVVIDVVVNDTDADDGLNPSSVSILTAPTAGTATANADGTVTYTHLAVGYDVVDSFTYTVADMSGAASNIATVEIRGENPGMLYTVRESDNFLIQIDPNTLAFTDVGPLGITFDFGGLAWDDTTGVLFLVDGRGAEGLYTVDLSTGAATLVGLHGINDMFGIVADNAGQLYGEGSGSWYSIDKTTGAAALIGNTLGQSEPVYDPILGDFYTVSYTGEVYTLDEATGATAAVGVPVPVWLDNSGSAWDTYIDVIWSIGWAGALTMHDPSAGFAQSLLAGGNGSHDGMAYVP